MAEARSEEEEDNMRDTREQVVRRQANSSGGRAERRKPEHRLSQGPLSSIRAAFKRTSTRSTSLSETPQDRERERARERERDRERARERDRRRPEITILSAEPLVSSSWFPGPCGGFPLPPPPPAQIWGSSIPPSIQPPPSYEEVIKEKTQEQVLRPSSSSCSISSTHSLSTITISTQTDKRSSPHPPDTQERPVRPPRPQPPFPRTVSCDDVTGDITSRTSSRTFDLLIDVASLSNSNCTAPTVGPASAPVEARTPATTFSHVLRERPRPRPRSKFSAVDDRVKVQTLVKLREDGLATLAARAGSEQGVTQGKYLQELLEAFSSDDWGFPDQHDSQSDTDDDEEDIEDMSTLKARIQAFEQQQNVMDDVKNVDGTDVGSPKRPEPQPRPRLLPAKSPPPIVAPKPKILSHKPSSKGFWESESSTEDSGQIDAATETNTEDQNEEAISTLTSATISVPQPYKKPDLTPKPASEPPHFSTPVPTPRPTSVKETLTAHPKPPPRPAAAPRVSLGSPLPEKSLKRRQTTPTLPPRPTVEPGSAVQMRSMSQDVETEIQTGVTTRQVVAAPRRASAPALAPKPVGHSQPETNPVHARPASVAAVTVSKPPAPALRQGTKAATSSSDPPLPPRPSSVKALPLRPPPVKSAPGRPPPPSINTPQTQHSPKSSCIPASAPPAGQVSSSLQTQKAQKKRPPLPPRPKPGHPLFDSYTKQEVLIVLDDLSPAPSAGEQTTSVHPPRDSSPCLLDLDTPPQLVLNQVSHTKVNLDNITAAESQSNVPVLSIETKEQTDTLVSGPRSVASFDYEGEEKGELTCLQGDVISLLEPVGDECVRGQSGNFPASFVSVVEPLVSDKNSSVLIESIATKTPESCAKEAEEWAVALFDFPGQTEEDLSFHKGALIQVVEHIDDEWRRGRVEGRVGLYPVAFTQNYQAQPISERQPASKGVAKAVFDFTAESEEELTMKAGDVITHVEAVDEQWIMGVVGGKRGIVPRNFISPVS